MRTVSPQLSALLALGSCNTQTTLAIYPKTGPNLYFATDAVTISGQAYQPHLIRTDVIRQSILVPTDRVRVQIQNVDRAIGAVIAAETLTRAEAVVGRLYRNENKPSEAEWVELFRGESVPVEINESAAVIEVVSDLVAAGYCVGNWTLASNCQFVFKDPATCGYTGAETTCNKRRKSVDGCSGRNNEHRFGGMEYPVLQASTAPSGGGSSGGGWTPGNCPREDQLVPVRSGDGIELKTAGTLTLDDELYNPLDGWFYPIKELTRHESTPIWQVTASNGVVGFSSGSHPIFPHRDHGLGVRVDSVNAGDDVLLADWTNRRLYQYRIADARIVGHGTVIRIEMDGGHVYGYAHDDGEFLIVCHNAKQVPGD